MRFVQIVILALTTSCGGSTTQQFASDTSKTHPDPQGTASLKSASEDSCAAEAQPQPATCPDNWGVCKTCVAGTWEVRRVDGSEPFVAAWLDTDEDGEPDALLRRRYNVMGHLQSEEWYRQTDPADPACSPKNQERWTTTVYRLGTTDVQCVSGDGYVMLKDVSANAPSVATDRCLEQSEPPSQDVIDRALQSAQLLFDNVRLELWQQEAPHRIAQDG